MLKLTKLVANRKTITRPSPVFEYATNLRGFEFGEQSNHRHILTYHPHLPNAFRSSTSNALETIEPLAGLINLRVLDLYNTGLKDITPLANLIALESLVLVRNMIVDISPLAGLENLQRLEITVKTLFVTLPLCSNLKA